MRKLTVSIASRVQLPEEVGSWVDRKVSTTSKRELGRASRRELEGQNETLRYWRKVCVTDFLPAGKYSTIFR